MFLRLSILAHAALFLLPLPIPALRATLVAGYLAYHVAVAWGVLHPRSRLFGPNLSRLETKEPECVLTFDDGPHPSVTPRVLDLLRERNVRATFFVIGAFAERHPEIVRRMLAEGHQVGNHSHTHPYTFFALPASGVVREVTRAGRAIEAAGHRPCRFFRAPVGMKSCLLAPVLRRQALRLVSWDVRFLDRGGTDRARVRARLSRRLVPGSILMLHDGHDRKPEGNPHVLEKLPLVLDALEELGYRCVELG